MPGDVGDVSLRDGCLRARHFTQLGLGGDTGVGINSYVDVTLTTAQILALFTTPITVIAAPGAGNAILVTEVYASQVYNSATYSCNASGISLKYTDGSGAAVGIALTQAFVQVSSGTAQLHVRGSATALIPVANAVIVAQAATSDPTTGNSAIKMRIFYKVVPAPLP